MGIGGVQLQRLVVGLAGQLGIDVAQVLVGHGVGRMGADGHFQSGAGLVVLLLLGVEHGQVVVGLRQFREILGELGEDRDGLIVAIQLGEDDAAQEASLGVLGTGGDVGIHFFQGLGVLSLSDHLLDIGDGNVGRQGNVGGTEPDQGADQQGRKQPGTAGMARQAGSWRKAGTHRCVILSRTI